MTTRSVAGAIAIYKENNVVLVSNKKTNLIFPKGGVKKHETFQDASIREANEEGGIVGVIEEDIFFEKKGIRFFILRVIDLLDVYDEKDIRERVILSIGDAQKTERTPLYVKEILIEYEATRAK